MRKKLLWLSLTILLILSLLGVNTIEVNAQETHDIAVISVTPSPTEVEVGDLVNITVAVENRGTEPETFNLTAYYSTSAIETKTVLNLAPNTNASHIFAWNTTGASTGIYAIKADVPPLPGETVTDDNTLVSLTRVRVFISPYIAVVPGSTVDPALAPGMNYTISVYTDYDGSDVWGYRFDLTFNPNVLEGIEVVNGDLITEDVGATMWNPGTFNNTKGTLQDVGNAFFAMLGEPMPLTSGPGTLANITFLVVDYGDSSITLSRAIDATKLIGLNAATEEPYDIIYAGWPDPILDGYFLNMGVQVIHDIAVISVTPSSTEVDAGDLVNITVVVENQGTMKEDVTVEVYRDHKPGITFWLIGTETVQNVQAGVVESLVLAWDTTDLSDTPSGNHTMTAIAKRLPGEEDTVDNMLESDEIVYVRRVEHQPLPIPLIIGIVIIAVAAISVVWYVSKRRGRQKRRRMEQY
jgi:hypothetical protein